MEYTIPKSPESQNPAPPPETQKPGMPTYDVPSGWVQVPNLPLSLDTYKVSKDEQETFLTVIPLSLMTDDKVLPNINRWRGQVKLPPLKPGEEAGSVKPMTVHGVKVRYVKLAGEDLKPGDEAMLVACFDYAGATWYFKLFGDAALTLEEEQNFLTFVQSVRFSPN